MSAVGGLQASLGRLAGERKDLQFPTAQEKEPGWSQRTLKLVRFRIELAQSGDRIG